MAERSLCELPLSTANLTILNLCIRLTAIYAQGVGLGAAKGKEIGKFSEGYSGYVQQAQEAVSNKTEALRGYSWSYRSQPSRLTLPSMLGSRTLRKLKSFPPLHLFFGLRILFLSYIIVSWFLLFKPIQASLSFRSQFCHSYNFNRVYQKLNKYPKVHMNDQ